MWRRVIHLYLCRLSLSHDFLDRQGTDNNSLPNTDTSSQGGACMYVCKTSEYMLAGSKPVAHDRADFGCEPHLDYGVVVVQDAVLRSLFCSIWKAG